MKPDRNLSGKSGVLAYAIGPDFIDVEFKGGASYRYSHRSAGREPVEATKLLAAAGRGLSTFIARVQPGYDIQP